MTHNDLTPLIEAGKKHIKGFAEYEYPEFMFWTLCPYETAATMVKAEFWPQYLERAIAIAKECQDMETFNARIHALNREIYSEWFDPDILI